MSARACALRLFPLAEPLPAKVAHLVVDDDGGTGTALARPAPVANGVATNGDGDAMDDDDDDGEGGEGGPSAAGQRGRKRAAAAGGAGDGATPAAKRPRQGGGGKGARGGA